MINKVETIDKMADRIKNTSKVLSGVPVKVINNEC